MSPEGSPAFAHSPVKIFFTLGRLILINLINFN